MEQMRRGFTLIELIIVVAVIAILATIVTLGYQGVTKRANDNAAQQYITQAVDAIGIYSANNRSYPNTLSDINLSNHDDVSYQYSVNNTINPQTWCLTVTKNTSSYFASNTNKRPQAGGCPGHGVGGLAPVTNLANDPRATALATVSYELHWGIHWYGSGTGGAGVTSVQSGKSDGPVGITSYIRKSWTSSPGGNMGDAGFNFAAAWASTATTGFPVAPNQAYAISCYMRATAGATWMARIQLQWHDSTGAIIAHPVGTTTNLPSGTWVRVSLVATAPATAASLSLGADTISSSPIAQPGDTLDGTGLMARLSIITPMAQAQIGYGTALSITLPQQVRRYRLDTYWVLVYTIEYAT